jgi:cellulose synthase/poly-beta-1,6-N-acetylglucosamine synthase-like glycosyltransferase
MIVKIIFYTAILGLFYVYIGYPILISLAALIVNKKVKKEINLPTVSILISAYNEEKNIGNTIQNKLELDYEPQKIEIIVVSDGSNDTTDEIVKTYAQKRVRLIRQKPRSGKTAALNLAVADATGEIIVFSDANSTWEKNALKHLVHNFNDPQVGYVTGKMIYSNPDGSAIGDGSTAYMHYENFLWQAETLTGSIVGVDGGIDAIRRELYRPMRADQLPDFVLPLMVVEEGYRVVFEPEAVLKESSLDKASDEYKMRVRVSLRSLWALKDMKKMLSLKGFRLYTLQLWSHKVLRYLCFVFLLTAYASNLFLWNSGTFFQSTFVLQTLFYVSAALFPFLEGNGIKLRLLRIFYYFCLVNFASAHAFVKFLLGRKQVVWEPRKG